MPVDDHRHLLNQALILLLVLLAQLVHGPTFEARRAFLATLLHLQQGGQVGPVSLGVFTGGYQHVVHHEVYLPEQGVEQQVHRPHHGLAACQAQVASPYHLDGHPINLQNLTFQVGIALAQV